VREYETVVIIQPEISDEGRQAIRDRLDGTLEEHGALRLLWSDLGKRKLAYEIRKFHKGHYYILHYLDEGRVIPELERLLRIDESVLRFMTVQVNECVVDIEARKAEARDLEIEQQKRAAEKAAREAEEASARAEVERIAAEEAAREAEEAKARAEEEAEEAKTRADEAEEQAPNVSEDDSPPVDPLETEASVAEDAENGEAAEGSEDAEDAEGSEDAENAENAENAEDAEDAKRGEDS
jgi:small subunit ribosomal protein S6